MTEMLRCQDTGKVCFSERDAHAKIAWFRKMNGRYNHHFGKSLPTRCYRCGFCGYWHLTKQSKRRRK